MAISRPLQIVLAVAVLALVGFYATQGARQSTGDEAAEVVTPPPTPDKASVGDSAKPEAAKRRGMPLSVARALADRKIVVLFFAGSGSTDDRETARAVAALRGQRGVAVFADRIRRLGRYRAVVGELGIAQAPAVVIVDRARSARVVEGYVDPATLAQDVADAR